MRALFDRSCNLFSSLAFMNFRPLLSFFFFGLVISPAQKLQLHVSVFSGSDFRFIIHRFNSATFKTPDNISQIIVERSFSVS